MELSQDLLDLLVCPETKKPLIYFEDKQALFCPASKLLYPIRDGIPVMLTEEAERLDEAKAQALLEEAKAKKLANADAD